MEKIVNAFMGLLKQEIEEAIEKKINECLPLAIRKGRRNPTMSSQQVMQALCIKSYSKLKKMRDDGVLSYIKEGNHIIYPTESIEKYMHEHMIKGDF